MTDAVLTNQLNEAAATYMADFAPGSVNAHVWPSLGLLTSRHIMVHCNNSRESERFSSMIFANPIPYGSVHRPSCFLAVLRIDIIRSDCERAHTLGTALTSLLFTFCPDKNTIALRLAKTPVTG